MVAYYTIFGQKVGSHVVRQGNYLRSHCSTQGAEFLCLEQVIKIQADNFSYSFQWQR